MRHLKLILMVCAYPIAAHVSAQELPWREQPSPAAIQAVESLPRVPKTDVYKVVPTKVDAAKVFLTRERFKEISCDQAKYFAGHNFSCGAPLKRPYLVRAVYENGGTGGFEIRYRDGTLYVLHGSLGKPSRVVNIPLIVNLPFVPIGVYAWTSGAM